VNIFKRNKMNTENRSYILWNNRLSRCKSIRDIGNISEEIGWGFTIEDIQTLAKLHSENKYRIWIEELLTDCNFHTECANMVKGEYDKILEVYN